MSIKTLLAGLGLAVTGLGAVTARAEEPEPQRMLFLGNSITWHEYNEGVGWLQEWGMAASAAEKDYVHLMSNDVERITGVAPVLRVRNIFNIERVILTADIDADAGIAADVAFAPTVVVIAIGENFTGPSAADSATFKSQIKKLAGKFTGTAALDKILIRAPFWSNPTQAALMKSAAEELGVKFVDAGPLGNVAANKATGLFPHAGVANHPGDTGMRALADLKMAALFPDEFASGTPGGEDLPPDAPDVTEVGEYAEADGKGEVVSIAPCIGGSIRRLSTGEYVHTFTGDGTLFVKDLDVDTEISYLIVGGGGSGGSLMGGGGGGGAARVGTFRLAKGSSATIHVGAGGIFVGAAGAAGESGTASEIWQDGYLVAAAAGGGGGAGWDDGASNDQIAKTGASSGGECHLRTTPTEATDGHRGGVAFAAGCVPGGGGGAGSPGQNGVAGQAGAGGAGVLCRITGEAAYYGAGGGGGANWNNDKTYSFLAGAGGSGVGGAGGSPGHPGGDALQNTGSGGGGSASNSAGACRGGSGANGIVVLRYAFSGEITIPDLPFEYSAVLTVSGYEGNEVLTDFPLLVRVSPEKIVGFNYAQSRQNGADVAFTAMSGDVLPCELDTWNPEGESLFWVSVPRLSGKDTQLMMRWGTDEPLAIDVRNTTALWKNYAGVWHFSESSGSALDSSSLGNDALLTSDSYLGTTTGTVGRVGRARHIVGVVNDSPLRTKDAIIPLAARNDFTVTCWYKFISAASPSGDHGIIWAKPTTAWDGSDGWFMSLRTLTGYPYVTGKGKVQHDATINAKDGWHYLTMIVRNGALVAGCDGKMVDVSGSGTPLNIQSSANGYFGYFATCEMDELRIRASSAVSPDCFVAEYAQMTNADFIVSSSDDAAVPVVRTVSALETGRGKARVSVDITSLGEGAQWADVQASFAVVGEAAPGYRTLGRVTATGVASFDVTGLKGGTDYEVHVQVVNSLDRTIRSVHPFATAIDLPTLGFSWYSVVSTPEFGLSDVVLADFPLMVRVSPQLISGFSYEDCRADGKDVVFFTTAGDLLPSELDTWDPSGESVFWVKVPKLSARTKVCVAWGRSSNRLVNTHPTDVWGDYVGVWHMNEPSGNAIDSTGRGHDAVLDAAFVETCVGTNDSKIGRARHIPQNVTVPASSTAISPLAVPAGCTVDSPANFSIQCWYKYQEYVFHTGDPGILYAKDPKTWNAADGWFFSANGTRAPYFNSQNNTQTKWGTTLSVGAWDKYVATVDQGTVRLYKNGSLVGTPIGHDGEAVTITNSTFPILFAPNVTCGMDEVRIRNKPISAAWAKQEYRSMTSASYLSFTPAKHLPKNGIAIFVK